jgi:hypothetical protein
MGTDAVQECITRARVDCGVLERAGITEPMIGGGSMSSLGALK